MSKHTPGTWKTTFVGDTFEEARYVIADPTAARPMLIADCWPETPFEFGLPDVEEYQANAKLIAAAPDMLDALTKIAAWWMETPDFKNGEDEMPADVFDDMLHAIRKATGETP